MTLVTKNKRIVVESEKQFWNKATKLAKAMDKRQTQKPIEDLSFQNIETLRKTLTPKKLKIIKEIRHKQPESIYELAKIMKTDYKNLIKDVNKLRILGLVAVKREKGYEKRKTSMPIVSFDSLEVKISV